MINPWVTMAWQKDFTKPFGINWKGIYVDSIREAKEIGHLRKSERLESLS